MSESWLITLAVFALVTLAALLFQAGAGALARDRTRRRERFEALAPGQANAMDEILRRVPRRDLPLLHALRRLVVQSGTSLSPNALGLLWLGLAILLYLLLPAPASGPVRLVTGLLAAALLVGLYLRLSRARRLARFGEQLPEVLDIVVRSLRAGHPLQVSLGLVAREVPEPAGPEFALLVDEVAYGRSVTEALDHLYQRVGYPELRFFVAATAIAHQTGGNLGEILSRLSRMLRERFRLMRRVRALSAEGRFSGYALSVLPVALFVLITLVSPSYYAEFWRSTAALTVVAVSLGLLVLGNLVIYRLVNLKV